MGKMWNYTIFDLNGDWSDVSDDFTTRAAAKAAAHKYVLENLCSHVVLSAHTPLEWIERSSTVIATKHP